MLASLLPCFFMMLFIKMHSHKDNFIVYSLSMFWNLLIFASLALPVVSTFLPLILMKILSLLKWAKQIVAILSVAG